jgi:hydrogenase/urease accessory protein HupE
MNKIKQSAIAIGSVLLPATAAAHPGPHSEDLTWSLLHAFTQADHLLTMAAVTIWASMFVCVAYWFIPWRGGSRAR